MWSVWLETDREKIPCGWFGWKMTQRTVLAASLAGHGAREIFWGPSWLETGVGGIHRGQSGWKPRLVDKLVQRAADGEAAAIEDVGVDLSGSHVFMAE